MNGPIQNADTLHASSIKLVDATNGKRLPHELPLLSSVPFGWRGIVVEWHRLKPQEMPEHYVDGHGLAVSTGTSSPARSIQVDIRRMTNWLIG